MISRSPVIVEFFCCFLSLGFLGTLFFTYSFSISSVSEMSSTSPENTCLAHLGQRKRKVKAKTEAVVTYREIFSELCFLI